MLELLQGMTTAETTPLPDGKRYADKAQAARMFYDLGAYEGQATRDLVTPGSLAKDAKRGKRVYVVSPDWEMVRCPNMINPSAVIEHWIVLDVKQDGNGWDVFDMEIDYSLKDCHVRDLKVTISAGWICRVANIVSQCPRFQKHLDEYHDAVNKAHRQFGSILRDDLRENRARTIRTSAVNQVRWPPQWKAGVDRLRGAPSRELTEGEELGNYLKWKQPSGFHELQPWGDSPPVEVDYDFLRNAARNLGAVSLDDRTSVRSPACGGPKVVELDRGYKVRGSIDWNGSLCETNLSPRRVVAQA